MSSNFILFWFSFLQGMFEVLHECMKMKNRKREEDEEMLIKLNVGDAPLDTMFLYNLTIPFLKNRSSG